MFFSSAAFLVMRIVLGLVGMPFFIILGILKERQGEYWQFPILYDLAKALGVEKI